MKRKIMKDNENYLKKVSVLQYSSKHLFIIAQVRKQPKDNLTLTDEWIKKI